MGKKYLETKENSLESSVLGIWQEAAKKADELDEAKFSPKEIKMAIGIASDKRYAGGNMTGAVKAIEKMKRGLSDHPQVMAVLKRQNENIEEGKVIFDDHDADDGDFKALTKKLGLKFKAKGDDTTVTGSDANIAKLLKTMKMKKDTDGHAMLEKLDPVNKKALKKDFDDRKDKDIDNDGDVDSSDKYLAKRRKAVSKAISKEEVELDEKKAKVLSIEFRSSADVKKARKWMDQNLPGADQGFTSVDYRVKSIQFEDVDDAEGLMSKLKKAGFKFKVDYREENELDVIENTMAKVREFKIQDMKAALAQVWGMEEGKNPFKKEEEEKEKPVITKGGKTLTGKKPAAIDVNPKIKV